MGASDFSKLPYIGEALKRKEDYRFLTRRRAVHRRRGAGRAMPCGVRALAARPRQDQQHDIDAAKAAPGVLGVFTGADAGRRQHQRPALWLAHHQHQRRAHEGAATPHPGPGAKVRYVGDHVAMVVAHTQQQARDAAELVEVDYDVLPAVVNVGRCWHRARWPVRWCTTLRKTTIASSGPLATRAVWTQRLPMQRICHQARPDQQPPDSQRHGAARSHRQLQPGQRRIHAVCQQPGTRTLSAC